MPLATAASWDGPPIAIFWDQSLVWGLICLETLEKLGIPFHMLSAEDVSSGNLYSYRVLLVPGGWASHKVRALGEAGKEAITRFISGGGSYIGFCGGAGLALSGRPALGIVPFERLSLSERLPSASGEIWVRGIINHPAWENLPQTIPVSIWWPSQFAWQPLPRSLCLASYEFPGADFRVADLPVADLQEQGIEWEELERKYGINLNPARMVGHPAMMEIKVGKGRLVLSYPHLETPHDYWGNRLFANMLTYLDRKASSEFTRKALEEPDPGPFNARPGPDALERLLEIKRLSDDLIEFGKRHLLWDWRRHWLLSWRRGIRGLEYGTLALAVQALVDGAKAANGHGSASAWLEPISKLEKDVKSFCHLAKLLLLEEKLAIHSGNLSKLGKVNEAVDELRGHLFGASMSHEGLCGSVMDGLDFLLLRMYRLRNDE